MHALNFIFAHAKNHFLSFDGSTLFVVLSVISYFSSYSTNSAQDRWT
ncbi:hypothetical protein JCM19294_2934 [Nonlabens tegetincola]|uniref:Uncharacterized protein n=1 Tax=Nonlabens tegetincola TaxID=323273 RepID=A0A090Q1S7_9FLAO|nr:hypothetical protein JCM19294_2934 [Nonlabens tegetincola]